jgi:hypothetical protein
MSSDPFSNMRSMGSGYQLLVKLTSRIDEPASAGHAIWLTMKEGELNDENHPFRGLAPAGSPWAGKRVRVRDLSRSEAKKLKVKYDPNDSRDVFHNLFMSYDELDSARIKGKNVLPAWGILNAFAIHFGSMLSIAQLKVALEGVLNPATDSDFQLLTRIGWVQHIAWGSGELVYGERFPHNPDLVPFQELTGRVAAIDEFSALPVIKWILSYIKD